MLIQWLFSVLLVALVAIGPAVQAEGLVLIPAEGGEPRPFVQEPGMQCGSPRWSPDGKWVAYDAVGGDLRRVFIAKPKTPEPTELDFGGLKIDVGDRVTERPLQGKVISDDGGMPSWSRDGKRLAWHTYRGGGVVVGNFSARKEKDSGIEVIDISPPVRVVRHWGNPVWLRKADRLVTINRDEFSVYDERTNRETRFYRPQGDPKWGYSISPTDDRIAYRTYDDELRIATIREAGFEEHRRLEARVEYASWSPDGKQLVVSWRSEVHQPPQLYLLDPDTDDPPVRIPGQDPATAYRQPDWSPDGKTIVCAYGD